MTGQPLVVGLPDRVRAPGRGEEGLVGRSDELTELADLLARGAGEVAVTQAPAITLHGQGGIGKTALAVEYAQTHQSRYQLVWWVNADTEVTTASCSRDLIRACGQDPDEDRLADQVNGILAGQSRWLAVFDNVADKAFYDRWRPTAGGGQVLITSRVTAGWSNPLELGRVDPDAALAWLLEAADNPTDTTELQAGGVLVTWLDGLALGLAMACGFLVTNKVSLARYRALYEANSAGLLGDEYIELPGYNKTIYTALAIDRARLRTNNADAAVLLLEYASFCAPDRIPLLLFPPDSLGVASEVEVLQALRALAELSLVTIDDQDTFSVHRLTQDVTRFLLDHPPPTPATEEPPEPAAQLDPTPRDRPNATAGGVEQTITNGGGNVQIGNANNVTINQAGDKATPEKNPRTERASWIVGIIAGLVAITVAAIAAWPTIRDWFTDTDQPAQPDTADLITGIQPPIEGPLAIVSGTGSAQCMYNGAVPEPVIITLAQPTRVIGLRISFTNDISDPTVLAVALDDQAPVDYPIGPLPAGQYQTLTLEAAQTITITITTTTGLCHLQINP